LNCCESSLTLTSSDIFKSVLPSPSEVDFSLETTTVFDSLSRTALGIEPSISLPSFLVDCSLAFVDVSVTKLGAKVNCTEVSVGIILNTFIMFSKSTILTSIPLIITNTFPINDSPVLNAWLSGSTLATTTPFNFPGSDSQNVIPNGLGILITMRLSEILIDSVLLPSSTFDDTPLS